MEFSVEQHQKMPFAGQLGIYNTPWESDGMGKTQWQIKKKPNQTPKQPSDFKGRRINP